MCVASLLSPAERRGGRSPPNQARDATARHCDAMRACWWPRVALWRSSEAVRPARGAAFEPEARQLAIALSPRERKTTAKALGAAHYASKTVLCFVQTRRCTLLRPFWSVLTAKPAEPILPPPLKMEDETASACVVRPCGPCGSRLGPKYPHLSRGLRVARAQLPLSPSSEPLDARHRAPLPPRSQIKKHTFTRQDHCWRWSGFAAGAARPTAGSTEADRPICEIWLSV